MSTRKPCERARRGDIDLFSESEFTLITKEAGRMAKDHPAAKGMDIKSIELLARKVGSWLRRRVESKMSKLPEVKRTLERQREERFWALIEAGIFGPDYYNRIKDATDAGDTQFFDRLAKTHRERKQRPLKIWTLTENERFVGSHWSKGVGGMKALSSLPTLGAMCSEAKHMGHIITKHTLRKTLKSLGYPKE